MQHEEPETGLRDARGTLRGPSCFISEVTLMPLRKWTKRSGSTVHKNPWWTYRKDDVTLPNGSSGEYHYVHTHGSSLIIPVRQDGRLVLVNQYRYLADKESVEFPCGGVKEGSDYERTAIQELEEEAGLMAGDWKIAGEYNPYNGVTNETCRVFIARNLHEIPARPDTTEEFEILTLTPEEFEAKIISGVVWDGMTMAAWIVARPYL